MKFSKILHSLVQNDPKIKQIPQFTIAGTATDYNHTQRRMQQRAINLDMIRVTLAYGKPQFHSKARTWTLLDKCLRNTSYECSIDRLRGLRVISPIWNRQENILITTVYWDFKLTH